MSADAVIKVEDVRGGMLCHPVAVNTNLNNGKSLCSYHRASVTRLLPQCAQRYARSHVIQFSTGPSGIG